MFSCQLFFYQMNQLEASCMRPLCSIANQEKVNQLIYLVHWILLMQKTIEESNTRKSYYHSSYMSKLRQTVITVIATNICGRLKKNLLLLRYNNFSPLSRPNVNRDLIRLAIYFFHISEHLVIIESFA